MPGTRDGCSIESGEFVTATAVCLMDTIRAFPSGVELALAFDPTSLILAED